MSGKDGNIDTNELYAKIMGSVGRVINEDNLAQVDMLVKLVNEDPNHPIAGKYFKLRDEDLASHAEKMGRIEEERLIRQGVQPGTPQFQDSVQRAKSTAIANERTRVLGTFNPVTKTGTGVISKNLAFANKRMEEGNPVLLSLIHI